MFCAKCGKELSETENFCPQCGNAAETAAEENQINEEQAAPAVTIAKTEAEKASEAAVAVEERPIGQPAEEIMQEEQSVQQEVTAENISLGVYNEAFEEEKASPKSKKGIIIGASAAVVVAGAAAVGYFCFSNEIMHLFMGDAGFAGLVEGNSIDYISGGELDADETDAVLADYAEQLFYGEEAPESDVTKSMLDQVLSIYGNSSVTVTTELDPGMLLSLADSEGVLDIFNLEMGIEAVQGDDCDRISYALNEKGQRTVGADVYLQEDKMIMLAPELTSESFLIKPEADESGEEAKERTEFSEAEMKRIREAVVDIYKDNLENTEIEFTKSGTDLVVSDCPVDSEGVIIRFSAENINTMLKEMGDFLRNDEYLRTYYVEATGEEITEYEKIFDETEYDTTAQLTIETYISDHAEVTGKKIIITETDAETSETFDFKFETTLGNCDFYAGNEEASVSFTQRKTDETGGVMEITIDGEEIGAPLVLEVNCSDVGTAEYCGQTVNTGTYLFKVSEKDEFFDYILKESSEAAEDNAEMMEETVSGSDMSSVVGMLKDIEIETSVKCDGSSVSSLFTLKVPLFFDITFTADVKPLEAEKPVMPDYSSAIEVDEDFDIEDYPEIQQEILENLEILGEKSEFIGNILSLAGIEY